MKYFRFSLIIFLTILSCSKEKENMNHRPSADFTYTDEIDHIALHDESKDIDGDILKPFWVSTCDTIQIINPDSSSAYFNLPKLTDPAQLKIKLVVSDGQLSDSTFKNITVPKSTFERIYGLGTNLYKGYSNNVNYNWYYDQINSGIYAYNNCGPASATMAIKWVDEDFNKTPEDARNTYFCDGGWWYTIDIINYLNKYLVNNYTITISDIDAIQEQINSDNIVILCLDMSYIRDQVNDNWHVDKFYHANSKGWGHFIVMKGYKIVDDEVYYEAYDPYSCGLKYSNDTLKGIDRYYRSQDLDSAVTNWWSYAIIVSKNKLKSVTTGVDVSKIIHKPGR
jgi:hypothetical protein